MLVFTGILVLFSALAIFFRKQITLYFIRLKHGKYSYQFVKQFKKYANKSPFPYCFKDDILPYLRLSISKRDSAERLKSEHEILFENIPFLTPVQSIINHYGNPNCFNAFIVKGIELRVFGYNRILFGNQIKVAFFIVGNVFIMGEYIIDDLAGINLEEIAGQILNLSKTETNNKTLHFIIDGKNEKSVLFYENGFSLLIRYHLRSDEILRKMTE